MLNTCVGILFGRGKAFVAMEEPVEVALLEVLENDPEIRYKKRANDSVDGHAEDDGRAEGYAAAGTCAGGEEHGHDTEHEGKGCHHDGAEAHAACVHRCLVNVLAGGAVVAGVFDNQDGVFGREAKQQYDAYLGVDADALVHKHAAYDGAEDGSGHGYDHGHGVGEALVLGGEDKECDDNGEDEHEGDGGARLCFLVGFARPCVGVVGAHGVVDYLFHGLDAVGRADTLGRGGGERRGGVHVVAAHGRRAH